MVHIMLIPTVLFLAMIAGHSASDGPRRQKMDPLPAKTLYDILMYEYHPMVRPSPRPNEHFTIKLGLRLSQINFVDEREQILSLSVLLRQVWHDSRLVWDPKDHQGVKMMHIPSEKIWIPDLVLYNNADGDFEVTLRTKALIYHTGTVVWEPPAIYKSYCPIDVEFFPFDIQECFLKFSSWTYHGNEVDLQHLCNGTALTPDSDSDNSEKTPEQLVTPRGIDLSSYFYNTEWDILNVTATRRVKFYPCCPDPFPDVTFNLTLRRRPLFYTVNLVIPCIAFLGLTLLVFYLPPASGEKVSLSISILLALTLFFLILTEMNPPTSLVIPLLGKYLLFIFLVVSLSVVISVFVSHVNLKSPTTDTLPTWARRIFIEILPRLLFMKEPDTNLDDVVSPKASPIESLLIRYGFDVKSNENTIETQRKTRTSQNYSKNQNVSERSRRCYEDDDVKTDTDDVKLVNVSDNPMGSTIPKTGKAMTSEHPPSLPPLLPDSSLSPSSSPHLPPEIQQAVEELAWIANHVKEAEEDTCQERDWQYIAIVLDRLFLFIFGTACFIGTMTIFLSAPSLYDSREHMSLEDSDGTCIY